MKRLKKVFWFSCTLLVLVIIYDTVAWQLHHDYKKQNALDGFKQTVIAQELSIKQFLNYSNEVPLQDAALIKGRKNLAKKGIYYYLYRNDSLKIWNTHSVLPPYFVDELYRPTFLLFQNGAYILYVSRQGQRKTVIIQELQKSYNSKSKHLNSYSKIRNNLMAYYEVTTTSEGEEQITLSTNLPICALNPVVAKKPEVFIATSYLLAFLFMFIGLLAFSFYIRLLIFLLFAAMLYLNIPQVLDVLPIFSSTVYSSGALVNSLGQIAIIVAMYVFLWHSLKNGFKKYLWFVGLLFCYLLVDDVGLNSKIPLHIYNIYNLSIYSIVLMLMLVGLLSTTLIDRNISFNGRYIIFHPLLISTIYMVLAYFNYLPYQLAILCLLYTLFWFVTQKLNAAKKIWITICYYSLACLGIAINLLNQDINRIEEQSKIVAHNILTEKDQIAEYILIETENKIAKDLYVFKYFTNPLLTKGLIIERINQLYLKGYLNKFESRLNLVSFKGKPVKNIHKKTLNEVSKKIADAEAVGKYFYVKTDNLIGSEYFALIYFTDNTQDTIGALSIELNEKAIYAESIFPELLIEGPRNNDSQLKGHAIYYQNHLVNTWGTIDYPVNRSSVINSNGNYNLFYKADEATEVVLTYPEHGTLQWVAAWGIMLLLCILFVLLKQLFENHRDLSTKNLFKQLWLIPYGQKIQYTLILSVFLAFIFITWVTVRYTQQKYTKAVYEVLNKRLSKIKEELSQSFDNGGNIENEVDKINELAKKLSRVYETDIDVYNTEGKLICTSQEILYDKGILAPIINGHCFQSLNNKEHTKLIISEQIGTLQYLSGYAALYKSNEIKAYIHLPYFSKERDLDKELSGFFITLFNIYLFLFLVLGILSYLISKALTRPLGYISSQIASTQLHSQTTIAWATDDEIGKLVNSYNQKVEELNKNALQLAENQKAEAWREMAKQVAHEIKNPLTPMRLNIQQLQRAWKDKHPKLEGMFTKITQVLIDQIESLSRIASEFSTYAKMPEVKKETLNLKTLFEDITTLYSGDININIEMICSLEKPLINGDRDQLFRALNNLIKNAIQATKANEKCHILVKLEESNKETLAISICDRGEGIPIEIQDKIFTPNFSTKSSGMGLGLAIVKTIIEQHAGKITFKSDKKGTCFYINLPFCKKNNYL